MAPQIYPVYYKLPGIPLESLSIENKIKHLNALRNPDAPRLVTYKIGTNTCISCSKISRHFCAYCCEMAFYCNDDCMHSKWLIHKDGYAITEIQYLNEVVDDRVKKQITKDLGKVVPDVNCAPIKIYHSRSVEPVKVMKRSILMNKQSIENNNLPNAIPYWCYWESSEKEYILSDSESEEYDAEPLKTALLYVDFIKNLFNENNIMESESEDQEYEPSESYSDNCELSEESEVSNHEDDYLIVECKVNSLIAESEQLDYPEFVKCVLDIKHALESDSEDQDYNLSESDSDDCWSSDESKISDHEVDNLIVEWKQYLRKHDYFYYKYFRSLLIADNPSKKYVLDDSDVGEFVPSAKSIDFQNEYIGNSHEESLDDEAQIILNNESNHFIDEYMQFLYDDFIERLYNNKLIMESDSEDQDYEPSESESDDYNLSDEYDCSNSEENSFIYKFKANYLSPEYKQTIEFVEMVSANEEFISSESESSNNESSETALYYVYHRNNIESELEVQESETSESYSDDCSLPELI